MKYYKILSDNLTHHEYVYYEGLNIDPQPWNDEECEPGGFYFTTAEYIFEFINYGSYICDVEIHPNAQVCHFNNKTKANKIFITNIRPLWTENTIQELINDGANIRGRNVHVLRWICRNRNIDAIQLLLSYVDNDCALRWVANYGHTDIVQSLISNGADIHAADDAALRWAAESGYYDTVQLLLNNGADIHASNDYAVAMASYFGHTDIVKLLIENGADIHANNDIALRLAAGNGHSEVVKLLIENGADIHADNDLASKAAYENGHIYVIKLLTQAEQQDIISNVLK